MTFQLPVAVVGLLLLYLCLWVGLMAFKKNLKVFVLPALSILTFPILGIDGTISVASLFAVASSLWFNKGIENYLTWIFLFLSVVKVLSVFHWLFFLPLGLKTPLGFIADFNLKVSYMVKNLAPYIVLIIIFICILKPLQRIFERGKPVFEIEEIQHSGGLSSRVVFFLLSIVVFSSLAAVYPYLQNINPNNKDVGVDIEGYVAYLVLSENDPTKAFEIMSGQRALLILISYAFQKLLNLDAITTIRFLPVFLNPLLALTSFFFTKEIFHDNRIAVWSSFFTIFSHVIAVGMYSYFLSNILGLCLVYISLGFLFKSFNCRELINYFSSFLFGSLILFTHPWTFDQYFIPLIIVLFIMPFLYKKGFFEHEINKDTISRIKYFVFCFLLLLFIVDLIKIYVFQGYGGIAALKSILARITPIHNFWYDFKFSFIYIYGGLIFNFISMGLILVGISTLKLKNFPKYYLWILTTITSILLLISNYNDKSRLFYNIPIGVFSAIGYVTILKNIKSDELKLTFSYFIFFNMVAYLFQSLANLI